jgi:hypothetical protein
MMRLVGPFVAGFLFALGLGVSGMTHPEKVIAFLDFFGAWDPSLGFVMAGAIGVYAPLSGIIARRAAPLCADGFSIPTRCDLDPKLVAGAALFGIGRGLGGFCPGPAIVAVPSANPAVLVFVASMIGGMAAFELRASVAVRSSSQSRNRLSIGGADGSCTDE